MRMIRWRNAGSSVCFRSLHERMGVSAEADGRVCVKYGEELSDVVATCTSAAHAEAVAKDLATWLCRPTLSDGTYLHQESIYDAKEAVERLRPEEASG